MEKTSIKEISPRDIEKAFSDALQNLTGKEWAVSMNNISFKQHDDELSLQASSESAEMGIHASTVRLPEKNPFTAF